MKPEKLKELRKLHGLTQAKMAKMIHCETRSYQRYEDGTREMHPAFAELLKIKLGKHRKPVKMLKVVEPRNYVLCFSAMDFMDKNDSTVEDSETGEKFTVEQAKVIWESGRVTDYNQSFRILFINDFDLDKVREYYLAFEQ